ncbi:MAG TPA: hypothetical protein VGB13_03580 [Candidatus Krumholzibacteria bacterium]
MRVVLYQQDRASANGLREVLELPAIDTFRKAVLKEVRRLAPGIGVVALAKVVTPEVQRDTEAAHLARVLPTDATLDEIATAVELTRESARPGVGKPVLDEEPE